MSGNTDVVDGVVAHDLDDVPDFTESDETPEVDAGDDQEDEQAEEQDEAEEVEETTDEADDEPEPEPEPEQGAHNRDKGLTKLQQRLAQERDERTEFQNEVKGTLAKLTEALEARNEDRPTKKQDKAVEDAQDDLAQLLDGEDDDIVDLATLKKLVGNITKQKPVDVQSEVQKALKEHEDQRKQQEAEQLRYVKQAEQRFNDEHPDLDGQFDTLTRAAIDALEKDQGESANEMDATEFNTLFNRIYWPQAVKKAEADASKPTATSKTRPAGKQPPKPSKGTSTKPQGASVKADSGTGSEIVGHDPEINEIPDFDLED